MLNITRNPQKKELVYVASKMSWNGEASPFEDVTKFPDGPAWKAHGEKMHDKSTRGLKNWVAARGGKLDSINTPGALSAWYDDYPTLYNTYDAGDETRAMVGHNRRMHPKKEATANEIKFEELYREYGDFIETVLMPQYDKHGHVYTPNQPLEPRVEIKTTVKETDYLGVPKESKGDTKRKRIYWIGKVYNTNNNGRRFAQNLVKELSVYFDVDRATIFRAAKYARACDDIGEGKKVVDPTWYIYREGETLKDYVRDKMMKPWDNPDNYGGKRGTSSRSFDAKFSDLRN